MDEKTTWSLIKKFIEEYKIGDLITRKELMEYFGSLKIPVSIWTLDVYRRYLTAANYLMHVKRGVYRLQYMPENVTLNGCRERAYPGYIQREKNRNKRNRKYF